jgi:hypothetical protein
MNITERRNYLSSLHEQGLIRPGAWSTDERGRHFVCLLSAISPEVEAEESASACPADVMPAWLAHLIVSAYDGASNDGRSRLVQLYLDTMTKWSQLSPAAWRQCDLTLRREALNIILPFAGTSGPVVIQVHALISRALNGDEPSEAQWAAAAAETAEAAAARAAAVRAAAAAKAEAAAWEARVETWDRIIRVLVTTMMTSVDNKD